MDGDWRLLAYSTLHHYMHRLVPYNRVIKSISISSIDKLLCTFLPGFEVVCLLKILIFVLLLIRRMNLIGSQHPRRWNLPSFTLTED